MNPVELDLLIACIDAFSYGGFLNLLLDSKNGLTVLFFKTILLNALG